MEYLMAGKRIRRTINDIKTNQNITTDHVKIKPIQ